MDIANKMNAVADASKNEAQALELDNALNKDLSSKDVTKVQVNEENLLRDMLGSRAKAKQNTLSKDWTAALGAVASKAANTNSAGGMALKDSLAEYSMHATGEDTALIDTIGTAIDKFAQNRPTSIAEIKEALAHIDGLKVVSVNDLKSDSGQSLLAATSADGTIRINAGLEGNGSALQAAAIEELAEFAFQKTAGMTSAGDFGSGVLSKVMGYGDKGLAMFKDPSMDDSFIVDGVAVEAMQGDPQFIPTINSNTQNINNNNLFPAAGNVWDQFGGFSFQAQQITTSLSSFTLRGTGGNPGFQNKQAFPLAQKGLGAINRYLDRLGSRIGNVAGLSPAQKEKLRGIANHFREMGGLDLPLPKNTTSAAKIRQDLTQLTQQGAYPGLKGLAAATRAKALNIGNRLLAAAGGTVNNNAAAQRFDAGKKSIVQLSQGGNLVGSTPVSIPNSRVSFRISDLRNVSRVYDSVAIGQASWNQLGNASSNAMRQAAYNVENFGNVAGSLADAIGNAGVSTITGDQKKRIAETVGQFRIEAKAMMTQAARLGSRFEQAVAAEANRVPQGADILGIAMGALGMYGGMAYGAIAAVPGGAGVFANWQAGVNASAGGAFSVGGAYGLAAGIQGFNTGFGKQFGDDLQRNYSEDRYNALIRPTSGILKLYDKLNQLGMKAAANALRTSLKGIADIGKRAFNSTSGAIGMAKLYRGDWIDKNDKTFGRGLNVNERNSILNITTQMQGAGWFVKPSSGILKSNANGQNLDERRYDVVINRLFDDGLSHEKFNAVLNFTDIKASGPQDSKSQPLGVFQKDVREFYAKETVISPEDLAERAFPGVRNIN